MTELERALVLLGRELGFPAEPDLRSRVRKRIERRRRVRRGLVFAVALVVVAFGIAMAVPDARSSILRFFVGLSEQEVADALKLPTGTVKSRSARALERLRESYD